MIKTQTDLNKDKYLITASLLNSWANIWNCKDYVRESQNDEICLEDKIAEAQEKAYNEFLTTLSRIPTEPNKYMLRGIEFEDECYKGNTIISPLIKGGAYQIVGKKDINIRDMDFLLYGRLDVLKGGKIIDIKRVSKYAPQKYIKSYQHVMYLKLFPKAYEFSYYAYDDNNVLHIETYYPDQVENIETIVDNFINWLAENELLEIYKEKWRSY